MHTLLFENGPSLKSCVDRNLMIELDKWDFECFAMDGEDAIRVQCKQGSWDGSFDPKLMLLTPDSTLEPLNIHSVIVKE